MGTVISPVREYSPEALLPLSYLQECWYAAYTCANHEKRVAEELTVREMQHFLPLYRSARRWRDRRVELELPLFPGYVFVRLALRDPFLNVGRRVRITGGPFAGLEGILKRKKSGLRVVVSLELIQRSVAVDVDAADVRPAAA